MSIVLRVGFLIAFWWLLLSQVGHATSPVVLSNVAYDTGSQGQPLLLDAYPAPSPGARSVIVVHGGAWVGGGKGEYRPVQTCRALQARGVACFSIDYELAPKARWPVQLENMRSALAWVKENASNYNGTSDVSVWGHSAGAHLALMLAFSEPGVRSVVGWSSPTDFTVGWGRRHALNLLGCTAQACPERARSASPVHVAHAGSPPILLAHSLGDHSVPYSQSSALASRLAEFGVPHRLDTYAGTAHGGGLFSQAFEASYGWWSS